MQLESVQVPYTSIKFKLKKNSNPVNPTKILLQLSTGKLLLTVP